MFLILRVSNYMFCGNRSEFFEDKIAQGHKITKGTKLHKNNFAQLT